MIAIIILCRYWDYVCATRAWAIEKLRSHKYITHVRMFEDKVVLTPPLPNHMEAEELIIRYDIHSFYFSDRALPYTSSFPFYAFIY